MKPKEKRGMGQNDLFKARYDQIVDMKPACEAREDDRLELSRTEVRRRL